MTNKLFIPSGIIAILTLLSIIPVMPASAGDATMQQVISTSINGFAFTNNNGCCPDVSVYLGGNMVTGTDGTITLSQQSGSITIGSTTYKLQFIPSGKLGTEIINDNNCSSGITYQQDGTVDLIGNDGTVIKGSGVYSWGTGPSCSGEKNSFTNFSGKIQDSVGQTSEFYTGTDLLPNIQ